MGSVADGLVEALGLRGRPKDRARQAIRLVVDDFGDAVAVQHRCPSCARWGQGKRGYCVDCHSWDQRQRYLKNPERERQKRKARREQRYADDPSLRARDYARNEEARAKRRASNIEHERALSRARGERYLVKLRKDPKRYKKRIDSMRIDNGLRSMRKGTKRQRKEAPHIEREDGGHVPAAPLAAALMAEIRTREGTSNGLTMGFVCEEAGIVSRTLYAWRVGERRFARFDVADRVLIGLDALWWDVYDPQAYPGLFCDRQRDDVLAWLDAVDCAARLWTGEGVL